MGFIQDPALRAGPTRSSATRSPSSTRRRASFGSASTARGLPCTSPTSASVATIRVLRWASSSIATSPSFVIQGGCPNTRDMSAEDVAAGKARPQPVAPAPAGPGYRIREEFSTNPNNSTRTAHSRWPRSADPNSAGSQFYFCLRVPSTGSTPATPSSARPSRAATSSGRCARATPSTRSGLSTPATRRSSAKAWRITVNQQAYEAGRHAYQSSDWVGAVTFLSGALGQGEVSGEVSHLLGNAYMKLGQYDAAARAYESALSPMPPYGKRGALQCNRGQRAARRVSPAGRRPGPHRRRLRRRSTRTPYKAYMALGSAYEQLGDIRQGGHGLPQRRHRRGQHGRPPSPSPTSAAAS